ncbi:MAG: DUF3810 domain-containing protein [Oscillospiraceae bacterium]|nr:DUF3810 domain-containing protein [Oscillospiraceae bacterium]
MKYWRGYLVAALVGLFTVALQQFAKSHTDLVDMVYPYVTRMIQTFLAQWSSGSAACVWQIAAVVLAVALVASIVLMIIFRWNLIQWLGWVLAAVSVVWCLNTGIYGLNYYSGPISADIRMAVTEATPDELKDATVYYRDLANSLSAQIQRSPDGEPVYPSFHELAESAGEGFQRLTYQRYMPIFAGSTLPVKELGWADMYTSMGITGFTMFLTGEAAVNPQIPAVSMPFTMCHEMAHRMCIAIESDANFAAFLACQAHSAPEFRYSGYFMAYMYCCNALSSLSPQTAREVMAGQSEYLTRDLAAYNAFFEENKDENAEKFADSVNDFYLKASGDEAGTESYAQVYELLVSWYIQEVILPLQVEDDEPAFDPYDESWVFQTITAPTEANG